LGICLFTSLLSTFGDAHESHDPALDWAVGRSGFNWLLLWQPKLVWPLVQLGAAVLSAADNSRARGTNRTDLHSRSGRAAAVLSVPLPVSAAAIYHLAV